MTGTEDEKDIGDSTGPGYFGYIRTHRNALGLLATGGLLEAAAITANYTIGANNPLDEVLSFVAACFMVAAGILVVFQLGYAARLVPFAGVLFVFSKFLDITRSLSYFDEVPFLGLTYVSSRILKDVSFVIGGLFLLASFIYSALEAHRAQARLRRQNETLLAEIEERKKAEDALRKSEESARAILNATSEQAFLMDIHGKLIAANENLAKTCGSNVAELPGTNIKELFPLEISVRRWQHVEAAIRTKSPVRFQDHHNHVWLDHSIYPILSKDGEVALLAVFARDITNEMSLERQLRQSQKMEAVGRLAGGIAHDFRNTLLLIMGHCELALRELPEDHPVRGNIRYIVNAGKRASELVKQILTFSRKEEREHRPVQIHQVVKEALRLLRATLPSTVEIRYRLDANCGIILSDATQIHQVVINLCNNAHQAMGPAGGLLDIVLDVADLTQEQPVEVGTLRPGQYIRLRISDNGCGIEPSVLPHIFDPFFTTKKFGEGTGLGLSTVHGIVTGSGGAITVSTEPGNGTVFTVFLPRHAAPPITASPPEQPLSRGTERILLLEDDEDVAFMTAQILRGLGYEVETCPDGEEGLALLKRGRRHFDLVVADNIMPRMTGLEVAAESLRSFPDLPFILVTGYSEGVTAEQAERMGISAYLSKPFSTHSLSEAVRRALDIPKTPAP